MVSSSCRQVGAVPDFDDLRSWFEADSRACFITSLDGSVLLSNPAGETMLRKGPLRTDAQNKLHIPRRGTRGPRSDTVACVGDQPHRALIVSLSREWIAVTVRRQSDRLFVTAARLDPDLDLDLRGFAEDLGLTECETPILAGLAKAVCPKQMSRELNLSVHTIRSHLRSIYGKLGVRGAAEAQLRVIQAYDTTA